MIIAYGRITEAKTDDYIYMTFNNDNGANYYRQGVYVLNASISNGQQETGKSNIRIGDWWGAASQRQTQASQTQVTIANYANTTFEKTCMAFTAATGGTASSAGWYSESAFWTSVAAINQIDLTPAGGNFKSGSRFTLYGF
jgi:hypothetical protein